jgi:hypothetical protein
MSWRYALTSTTLLGLSAKTGTASLALALALSGCAAQTSPAPTDGLPTVTLTSVLTETPVPTPALSATKELAATQLPATGTPEITVTPPAAAMDCPEGETTCIVPGHFVFRRPVDPSANNAIDQTYRYGTTQDDKREPHHGIDFPNKQGTSVLAAGDGKVVVAGNDKLALYGWVTSFYGNLVVIEHPLPGFNGTVYTLYGHLYKIKVSPGQQVKAGDPIGEVGATGIAIGSHLHFEVRIGANTYKSTRNPELWLQPPDGMGVLAGRVLDGRGKPVKSAVTIQRLDENGATLLDPIFEAETYARESLNSDDVFHETFAVGELATGMYRLTLIYNGKLYEQKVKIEPGKLTLITFALGG